jgi:hypothetical protein
MKTDTNSRRGAKVAISCAALAAKTREAQRGQKAEGRRQKKRDWGGIIAPPFKAGV